MVPINPLGLLAPNTIYNPQEMFYSWTTLQVIPSTWESLSDTSHLDFSSQIFINKDMKYSHKIPVQNLGSNDTR